MTERQRQTMRVRPSRGTHERQADDVAARALRGERGVSRFLTPAPAAGLRVPSSVGETIPRGWQDEFEIALGADLSAVRIHHDAAAAAAARRHSADAFASGRHVYFGEGRYRPDSPAGRGLLLHELAHVLQQTGRTGGGGRLRATAARGAGAVQLQPETKGAVAVSLEDQLKQLEVMQPPPAAQIQATLKNVASRHGEAEDADDDSKAHATAIEELAGTTADRDVLADALVDKTTDPAFPKSSRPTIRLYFDCFKTLNRFDRAMALVGNDAGKIPDRTAALLFSFYSAKMRGEEPTMPATLKTNSAAARYWKRAVIDSYRIAFYGLIRVPQDLDPQGAFRKAISEEFARVVLETPLAQNERMGVALLAFQSFNAIRIHDLSRPPDSPGTTPTLLQLAAERIAAIKNFAEGGRLRQRAEASQASPEVVDLCAEIDDDVAPLAREATNFWTRVQQRAKTIVAPGQSSEPALDSETLEANQAEFLATIKTIGPLKGLEARLQAVAQTTMRLGPGGKLPSESLYRANLGAGHQQLASAIFSYDQGLIQIQRELWKDRDAPAARRNDAERVELWIKQAEAYGIVLLLAMSVDSEIRNLDAGPELERGVKPTALSTRARADRVLRHFRYLAVRFYQLGALLGYADLQTLAARIARAEAPGLTQSYVGLFGSFVPKATTLDEFNEHFPRLTLRGFEPLTGADVVMLVYELYYSALADRLKEVLAARTAGGKERREVYDPNLEPIVNEAVESLTAFKPPHRFLMPIEDVELYIRGRDEHEMAGAVATHPLYQSFKDSALGNGELAVVPDELRDHLQAGGVVFWAVPNFKQIVFTLGAIPKLTEAKLENGKPLGKPTEGNWAAWVANLKKLKDGPQQWSDAIFQALKASMDQAWTTLEGPLREASINLRRSRMPQVLEGWQKYDPANLVQFGVPNRLIEATLGLGASLQPVTEKRLHVSALFLELAPAMHAKLAPQPGLLGFAGTNRLDLILLLLPHLVGATNLLGDQQQADKVKALKLAFPDAEFALRSRQLQDIRTHFETVQTTQQEETQLGGDASKQMIFVPGRGYPIVAGAEDGSDRFKIEGIRYELVHVHATFTYVPSMAVPSSAIEWPASKVGKSELFDSGQKPIDEHRDQVKLFDIKRNGRLITVTGADDRLLSEITYAVQMELVLRQLADLAILIEGLGELITTGLQIAFPEFAAPIAYAEIAGSALRFFTSKDFDDIKESLEGDTSELLDSLWKTIKDDFAVDRLWDYLLFDRDILGPIAVLKPLAGALKQQGRVERKGRRDETKSNVVRVFRRLMGVGEGVGHAVVTLHDRVNVPVRHAQLFVLDHPVVALVLRAIARNLFRLEALRLSNLQEDVTDLTEEAVLGRVGELLGKVEKAFAALDEIELPKEIVPVDLVLEMITNFVIDHLPLKYRLSAKGFRLGLQAAHVWDKFFKFVASEVKHSGLDPNLIWQQTIRSELEPHFEGAVKKVAKEINELVTRVPFLKKVTQVTAPSIKLQIAGDEFPSAGDEEAQPMPLAAGEPRAPLAWRLPSAGAGRPLDSATLTDAGLRLGHDFSHVRLHTDEAARHVTGGFRARALTSGSHVFVQPDLGPHRRVLYHELAHVVQQTGARPLGGRYSSRDSWGLPGKGLTFEPSLEADADRVAGAASAGKAGRPASPGGAAAVGIQPSLTDVVGRFFTELGDPRMVREHAAKIEKLGKTDQSGWPQEAKDLAKEQAGRSLGTALVDSLRGKGSVKAKFDSPFNVGAAPGLIADHLDSKKTLDFGDVVGRLVRKSLVPVTKDAKDPDAKNKDKFTFDPTTFVFELQDYLLGKTGILLDIKPKLEAGSGGPKVLNSIDPFAAVTVSYVHLPLVGPVSTLWRTVIANTFPKLTEEERNKRQSKAWLVLLGLAPTPGVYQKSKIAGKDELVLSRMIVDRIEAALEPKTALTADALPPWSDYVKTTEVTPIVPKFGQIGLRLGTYAQRTAPSGLQYGQDRDAHHTVQFLLIEYLNNKKDVQPFRHGLSLYPGVEGKGGSVDHIGVVDAAGSLTGEAIGVKTPLSKQIPDRAPAMPTILLSRHAHRLGDVHITPKADDTADRQSTQGGAVHGIFRTKLGKYSEMVLGSSNAHLRGIRDREAGKAVGPGIGEVDGKPVTSVGLSQAIYSATCETYREVRNEMQTKLEKALGDTEVEYYESVVKTDTTGTKYDQTTKQVVDHAFKAEPGRLSTVKKAAATNTKTKMNEAFGFPV